MPFDGTTYLQQSATLSTADRAHKYRRLVYRTMSYAVIGYLVCISSEFLFPDRGLITLISQGPSVVHQNAIWHDLANHAKRLEFSVGRHHYVILTPVHTLTAEEQTAWFGFATRKGLPIYSVDGPMATDP